MDCPASGGLRMPPASTLSKSRGRATKPAFRALNTILGNIKSAIGGTNRAVRKKHVARYLAEFEWRFNHRFDLAQMVPDLARAALRARPAPYWYLKVGDYGAQSGSQITFYGSRPASTVHGQFAPKLG